MGLADLSLDAWAGADLQGGERDIRGDLNERCAWLGDALLQGGSAIESWGWESRYLLEHPEDPERSLGRLLQERASFFLGDYQGVQRACLQATGEALSQDVINQALFWKGRADFSQGQYQSGLESLARINLAGGSFPEHQEEVGFGQLGEQDILFWSGRCLFALGRYPEALQSFVGAVNRGDGSGQDGTDHREIARLYIGASLLGIGRYSEAAVAFSEFLDSYPQSVFFAEVSYLCGLAEYQGASFAEASLSLARALVRHPYFGLGPKVAREPGPLPIEAVPPEGIDAAVQRDPALRWGDDCLYLLACTAYLDRRLPEAIRYFSYLWTYFPESRFSDEARFRCGLIQLEEEDYTSGKEMLGRALERVGQGSLPEEYGGEALFRMGWNRFSHSQWVEARDYFLRLLRDYPGHPRQEEALFLAAESAYELRDYSSAVQGYQRLRATHPRGLLGSYAQYGIGWCSLRQRQLLRAADAFEQLAWQYPESRLRGEATYLVAQSYYQANDWAHAVTSFRRFLNDYPRDKQSGEAQFSLSNALYALGSYEEASREFGRVLVLYPHSSHRAQAQMGVASSQFALKEYAQAEESYARVLEMTSATETIDEARYQMERCYYHLGFYRSPVEISLNYVAKYPASTRSAQLLLELGEYYLQTDDFDRALGAFKKVISDFSFANLADQAQEAVARTYRKAGQVSRAVEEYRSLREHYPTSPLAARAQYEIGRIYQEQGEYDSALREYRRASSDFPKSAWAPRALLESGRIYQTLGRLDELRTLVEQVLQRYPDSEIVGGAYALEGESYLSEGQPRRAREILEEGIKKVRDPAGRARLLMLSGESSLAEEKLGTALAAFSKALQARPGDPEVIARAGLGAGTAAEALGDRERAEGFYRQAADAEKAPWSRSARERLANLGGKRE